MAERDRVLVTGATGHVGRQVVAQLHAAGTPVRAVTRNPEAAGLPDGVQVVRADLSDPNTLEPPLEGVKRVFLVWPFFTSEGAPALLEPLAKHARRVVYLSSMGGRDQHGRNTDPIPLHAEIEGLIERSGLEWTFLRPSGFATNTIMWAPQIRAGGVVRWPYGAAARSLIHERDIAAVAVRTLTGDAHAGARYLLTGPETLTQAGQVTIIGEAIGRRTRFEEIPAEAARRQLLSAWGDPGFVESALNTWAGFVREPELVTSTVEAVTGAPARSFRQWALDRAGDFR